MNADQGGLTGVREAIVSAQMLELGQVSLGSVSPEGVRSIQGWFQDPYDPESDEDAVNSVTDDERLDVIFPKHPLSRVRHALRQVRDTLEVKGDSPVSPVECSAGEAPRHTDGPRRLLSTSVVRELRRKHERFDYSEL